MIQIINNPGRCVNIHRGLTIPIDCKGINAMAESDSTKKAEKIKFKFCGCCGRLLPATTMYFQQSRNGRGCVHLHSFCKKCKYTQKRLWEAKNIGHLKNYRKEYLEKHPRDKEAEKAYTRGRYLKQIGETEGSLAKKKAKKTTILRKKRLYKKAAKLNPNSVDIFGNKKCGACEKLKPADGFRYQVCGDCRKNLFMQIRTRQATFKRVSTLSVYEEVRRDPKDKALGQCRCAYCGRWINPTNSAVDGRINAVQNIGMGESRIYCAGDQCRTACPTYGQLMYPKGFKQNSSREVDPAIRIMCMERDNWTCQRCEANDLDTILHAHHILSYKRNIMLANDIENVICLCKDCHHEIHMKEGCKYHELRC